MYQIYMSAPDKRNAWIEIEIAFLPVVPFAVWASSLFRVSREENIWPPLFSPCLFVYSGTIGTNDTYKNRIFSSLVSNFSGTSVVVLATINLQLHCFRFLHLLLLLLRMQGCFRSTSCLP